MQKRKETDIVYAILKYLQVLENLGKIAHCDRVNSGMFKVGKRMIRGARPGTADIIAYLNTGIVMHFEVKTDTGKQSKAQIMFMEKIRLIDNHFYRVVRSTDDVTFALKQMGVRV